THRLLRLEIPATCSEGAHETCQSKAIIVDNFQCLLKSRSGQCRLVVSEVCLAENIVENASTSENGILLSILKVLLGGFRQHRKTLWCIAFCQCQSSLEFGRLQRVRFC